MSEERREDRREAKVAAVSYGVRRRSRCGREPRHTRSTSGTSLTVWGLAKSGETRFSGRYQFSSDGASHASNASHANYSDFRVNCHDVVCD
jgi:hypothetical protein